MASDRGETSREGGSQTNRSVRTRQGVELPPGQPARRVHADHPPFLYPDYRSTMARSPDRDMVRVIASLSERTGPGPAWSALSPADADLTTNAGTGGRAIGARTIITGRVLDGHGNPAPGTLIEIWQANAAGRYTHWRETEYDAPLDPNFLGVGQCHTDDEGRYEFLTIRPGPYPWGNHPNAWRPAHVHLSLMGPELGSRLVTQLYFAGDPMLELDPIYCSAPPHSRHRMLAHYDHDVSVENWATGWRFDVVLAGQHATPFERQED